MVLKEGAMRLLMHFLLTWQGFHLNMFHGEKKKNSFILYFPISLFVSIYYLLVNLRPFKRR